MSFFSWALLDRKTGEIVGSGNLADPGDTMSMIKAWIAADYLRERTAIPERAVLRKLSIMIRDSDNDAAVEFHRLNGHAASIDRMVMICGLTESHAGRVAYRWSDTVMSARDTARLGACIADGRAGGPWTDWLLTQMRGVRGEGDFGPRKALPRDVAKQVAVKNGWFSRDDGLWHYACMAVSDSWSMGILMRYPKRLGGGPGRTNCQAAAARMLPLLRL